jgi:hypothetical protein
LFESGDARIKRGDRFTYRWRSRLALRAWWSLRSLRTLNALIAFRTLRPYRPWRSGDKVFRVS